MIFYCSVSPHFAIVDFFNVGITVFCFLFVTVSHTWATFGQFLLLFCLIRFHSLHFVHLMVYCASLFWAFWVILGNIFVPHFACHFWFWLFPWSFLCFLFIIGFVAFVVVVVGIS